VRLEAGWSARAIFGADQLVGREVTDRTNQLEAITIGHAEVGQAHVRALTAEHDEGFIGAGDREHSSPARAGELRQHLPRIVVVVDHQHRQMGNRSRRRVRGARPGLRRAPCCASATGSAGNRM